MNAVGLLGSYISRGVYTVSGPFHPFGGAVDIVVVEQQDGSFKSSPWYVRFGKFQGVLKTKEKVVNIIVNGVEANFQMYLDHKGEAFFLREVDVEGESGLYPSSSGDETEGKLQQELDRKILGSIDGIEKSQDNGKIVTETSSRRQILGFVWGRKSMKEDHLEDTSVARVDSLERAEIAADLLEVRWSTNIRTQKLEKSDSSKFSSIDTSDGKDEEKLKRDDGNSLVTSAVEVNMGNSLYKDCDTCSEQITNGSQLALGNVETSIEVTREMSSLNTKDQVVETSIIGEKAVDGTYEVKSAEGDIEQNAKDTVCTMGTISENEDSKSQISLSKNCDSSYGDGETFIGQRLSDETIFVSQVFNISEDKSEPDAVQFSMSHETSKSAMFLLDDSRVLTHEVSHLANGGSGIVGVHTEGLHVTTGVLPEGTDSSVVAEDFEIETEKAEVIMNYSQQVEHCNTSVYEGKTMDQGKPLTLVASYTQIVSTEEMPDSVKELKSDSIGSSFSSDFQDDERVDGSVTSKFQNSLNSIGNRVIAKESDIMPSTNSDFEIETEKAEVIMNYSQQVEHCNTSVYEGNTMDQGKPLTLAASYTQIVSTEEMPDSVKELKFDRIGSSFNSDFQDDERVDGSVTSKFQNSLNSIGNRVIAKESDIMPSTNSDFEIETEKVEVIMNYSQQVEHCNTSVYEGNTMDQGKPLTLAASYTQIVSTEEMLDSVKELKSDSIGSSFSSDFQDDERVDGSVTSTFQNSLNSIGNRVITKESHIMASTNSDDEQFLFSDFDVSKTEVNGNLESDSQHYNDKEEYPLAYASSIDEEPEDGFVNRSYETCTSPDSHEISNQGDASPITIPQSHPISNKEDERLAASLPNMQAGIDDPITCKIKHPLSHSVDSNSKSSKWMELCKDNSSSNSGGNGEEKVAEEQLKSEGSWVSEELKSILPNSAVGSPAEATVDPVGNWKLWPFSFKRSSSRKGTQSAVDDYTDFDIKKASDRNIGMDGEASSFKHKAEKKMVRSISPTSEQLASLNLKEGGNTVTFTFYTAVLGKQEVDARIYLWKWNTRVVISDVDGTITKSDVLGQFMPFVGMDWSQTGVTNLFSAIKENGYQLLFLSARSISQAYHTRQFLFNLKQDGKALPEGPVVISPDGLFPSLYREVIRRAPHEFKIACLERIRELFPPDCNPFYAGFGNRDTDEFSYLKVGIPKGKIFIINPKGEVVVNRRVDTKSYTSLHALVNGMFPPTTSSEQEDYNSWNYWKLPPPSVDF